MRIAAAAVLLLAGGCALLRPGAEQSLEADAVIGEALSAASAPASEQKAALSQAQQAFVHTQDPLDRLRLGALLVVLPAPLRDDARAAELLAPIADASSGGIGRFAALLSSQAAERQRLGQELERAARETARLEKDRERADKERDQREEALRQQLAALRSIERGILDREDRLRGKQR
jgi:hypothetical protein